MMIATTTLTCLTLFYPSHKRAPAHTYKSRFHCAKAKQNFAIPLDSVFSLFVLLLKESCRKICFRQSSRQNQLKKYFLENLKAHQLFGRIILAKFSIQENVFKAFIVSSAVNIVCEYVII